MKQKIIIAILILSLFLSGSYIDENIEKNLETAEKSGFLNSVSSETIEILEKAGIDGLDLEKLSSVSFYDFIIIVLSLLKIFIHFCNESVSLTS